MSEDTTGSEQTSQASVESSTPAQETGSSDISQKTESPDWKTSLPDEIKSDPSLSDIQDVANLAKSYINGQKLIGKDKIALPGKDATDTEMSAFYSQIGRPETSSNYKFGDKPNLPEGLKYDENLEKGFKDAAHVAGLTNTQAKSLHDFYNTYIGKEFEASNEKGTAMKEEWTKELKQEFGKAFDERTDLAKRAVDKFGGDDFKKYLDETGMGNNPMLVKLFANIGELIAEGKGDTGESGTFIMTPDAAKREVARYNRDPEFMKAYNGTDHPGHDEAVSKMTSLFKLAYPDESPVEPA